VGCLGLLLVLSACAELGQSRLALIAKWDRFERTFQSATSYPDPFQQVRLQVAFHAPSGETRLVEAFWDGDLNWRVRFAPDQIGNWSYTTICSDPANRELRNQTGAFVCTAPAARDRFTAHGPIQLSPDHRSLTHQDGTPFFWLADTAWNGPLLSTPSDWEFYLSQRARQKFTVVQWVTTQWRAAPEGDREKELAYTGVDRISVNPAFFRRLDLKLDAMNRAGLLGAPVLLWAFGGGTNPAVNPGVSLPDSQAILLARYMVARWGANDVVWILNGDGDYRGDRAERWKRIGRAVFGEGPHAPVSLHPGGRVWVLNEFRNEAWLDICGYQSGHDETDPNLRWIVAGPPATAWKGEPARPFLSLEAPYEGHNGANHRRISAFAVRRAHYWSLLNAPTAGVTYGGHGVWGWDDGSKTPVDHPGAGVPLPWREALLMEGAEQMTHLAEFFEAIDFGRLRPAPEMLANQPGVLTPARHISAARTEAGDLAVVYVPQDRSAPLLIQYLPPHFKAVWLNPRTGERAAVAAVVNDRSIDFATPADGDWLLLLQSENK